MSHNHRLIFAGIPFAIMLVAAVIVIADEQIAECDNYKVCENEVGPTCGKQKECYQLGADCNYCNGWDNPHRVCSGGGTAIQNCEYFYDDNGCGWMDERQCQGAEPPGTCVFIGTLSEEPCQSRNCDDECEIVPQGQ